jgi:Sulfotransferase domain
MIKPNTFIIGVQKAATTSLYNWLAQHPDICGPSSIKDFPFFIKEEYLNKGIEYLEKEYLKGGYLNQKIILHGCVQYMFEEKAIENIFEFNSKAKLICVLRNPTDRALSAYKFFKKLNKEKRSFKSALNFENECMKGTFQQKHDFTYKAHGLYAQQLERVYKKFKKEQVLILLYEDVTDNPQLIINQAFKFLNVDSSFIPEFKVLNTTGEIKYKILQNIFFNKSKFKKLIVDNLVDPILPIHKRAKIKWAFTDWNTKKKDIKSKETEFEKEILFLKNYFKEDILKLEKLIERNLDAWK